MKKVIRKIFLILSYLWPIFLNEFFIKLRKILYSSWKCRFIGKVGNSVFFSPTCYLIGGKYIAIGEEVSFTHHTILTAWDSHHNQKFTPSIKIGNRCHFGEYNHITAINRIEIGDDVLTGRWVTITDNSHGKFSAEDLEMNPIIRPVYSKGPVVIGNRVWIGDKVTILPDVTIGDGCIIAANAVVTTSIPERCMVAGNPAKVLKRLV